MATISERIKAALEMRNMKQSDLVARTGINKGSLSCYISGKYIPKNGNIFLMAKALNVSDRWLMGFDEPIERNEAELPFSDTENVEVGEMLKLFHDASPEMRKAALAVLKSARQPDEQKDQRSGTDE